LLKPDAREMEHGLELHAQALVCDAYAFAPRPAVDGEALKAAVNAGASEAELQDLSEEMMMTRQVRCPAEREEFLRAWSAAGVTCIFQNAGEESQAPLRLVKRLARFTYTTDMLREHLLRAATPADIARAHEQGKRCLYLTANGVPLSQDWISVEEELRYIRIFFQLGVRMMHLAYNRRNLLGDGCMEPANAGLSDFGRIVIGEMNRVGILIDVAHAGWRTGAEAAAVSSCSIVASHSACHALNPHRRCKPDEVLRAIADHDGYVGICCVPAFLGGSGDINALLDHIDYAVKKIGVEHVAIGTDNAYTSQAEAAERRKIPERRLPRSPWEQFWQPNEPLVDPAWNRPHQLQSLAWTNWPLFTVGLICRGYRDEDILKIIGGNVVRVARAVWDLAQAHR
jgi:membrane dipeptidase